MQLKKEARGLKNVEVIRSHGTMRVLIPCAPAAHKLDQSSDRPLQPRSKADVGILVMMFVVKGDKNPDRSRR